MKSTKRSKKGLIRVHLPSSRHENKSLENWNEWNYYIYIFQYLRQSINGKVHRIKICLKAINDDYREFSLTGYGLFLFIVNVPLDFSCCL